MKIGVLKNFVGVLVVLCCIVFLSLASTHFTNGIICLSVLGFCNALLAYTRCVVFDSVENKLSLINYYFDSSFFECEKSMPLNKYKSCCVSQKNKNLYPNYNSKKHPTIKYVNVYFLRLFTECGILEPFRERESAKEIENYVNKIDEFMYCKQEKLVLKDDSLCVLRYLGYLLLFLSIVLGIIDLSGIKV